MNTIKMPIEELSYKKYASTYDLIHADKDYAGETKKLKQYIRQHKKSPGNDLLDVACGTGKHLVYLKSEFSCTGIDKYKDMLRIARERVKGVEFKQEDMETFNLRKRFDIITCLYSSIAYTKTLPKLRATINNFARHLKPGGIAIIEPYFTKKTMSKNPFRFSFYRGKDTKVIRIGISRPVGNMALRKAITIVIEGNKKISSFNETRDVGLFGTKQILELMEKAGLQATFLKQGLDKRLGLYIGLKK